MGKKLLEKELNKDCWLKTPPHYQCCCKCRFQKKHKECHLFVDLCDDDDLKLANVHKINNHSIGCEMYDEIA